MGRPCPCCCEGGAVIKKGPWTPEEDKKLVEYVEQSGTGRWRSLPKNAGLNRCGKSCRLRWTNYLRPDIKKGNFSDQEEQIVIHLHSILGNKWSTIARHIPGRTDNEIKKYWNSIHLRKKKRKLKSGGIDLVTLQQRTDLISRKLASVLLMPTNYMLSDHDLAFPNTFNNIDHSLLLQADNAAANFSRIQNFFHTLIVQAINALYSPYHPTTAPNTHATILSKFLGSSSLEQNYDQLDHNDLLQFNRQDDQEVLMIYHALAALNQDPVINIALPNYDPSLFMLNPFPSNYYVSNSNIIASIESQKMTIQSSDSFLAEAYTKMEDYDNNGNSYAELINSSSTPLAPSSRENIYMEARMQDQIGLKASAPLKPWQKLNEDAQYY